MRRATSSRIISSSVIAYFYPRSPCGERLDEIPYQRQIYQFLSTLSLRRATINRAVNIIESCYFYPRSPCGERREKPRQTRTDTSISIHALLAESDHFIKEDVSYNIISIHALLAESDLVSMLNRPNGKISIHALLAESDHHQFPRQSPEKSFLSTLSLRRAT